MRTHGGRWRKGIDPSAERKAAKEARQVTFELVAEEWLALQAKKLAPVTYDKARWMLSTFIYPRLGSRPIAEITAPELLLLHCHLVNSQHTHIRAFPAGNIPAFPHRERPDVH